MRRGGFTAATGATILTAALLWLPGAAAAATRHARRASTGGAAAQPVAKPPQPLATIATVDCVPRQRCGAVPSHVSLHGGLLEISGTGVHSKMGVWFASRVHGKRLGPLYAHAPRAHLRAGPLGLVVSIPQHAVTGRITVMLGGNRHTNLYGPIYVLNHKLHPPPPPPPPPPATPEPTPTGTAFDGQGMWIWYISKSNGGNIASIAEQAKADGVSTVFVKSSDGPENYWSQFSPELVQQLHAAGLKVCAWQFVYGSQPLGEASLGAKAVEAGADCLVIDAESSYEGRYGAAQRYIDALREKVGPEYPIGLASFPYVDYHESLPYSVFLGPSGAQFNLPQMYWKDIGVSVEEVYVHTYEQNLIYGRPIEPLGQTYSKPSNSELVAFRTLAGAYGSSGYSFWDWQETTAKGWEALTEPLNPAITPPSPEMTSPLLRKGSKGDQVLWMQEHLASAVSTQQTTGIFESETLSNLMQFQEAHGLSATGETDPETWADLLALAPVAVDWTGANPKA